MAEARHKQNHLHPTKGWRSDKAFGRRAPKLSREAKALIASAGCVTTLRKVERAGVKAITVKHPEKYLNASARAA